jgi:hypothetical protein
MKRKSVVAGVTLASLLFISLVPSAASARHFKTRLALDAVGLVYPDGSYDWLYGGFVGQRPFGFQCIGGRTVRVFRDEPVGQDTFIGSKRTNFLGQALIYQRNPDLSTIAGDYYAKVRPTKRHSRHGTARCSGATSKTLTIHTPQLRPVATRGEGATRLTR